MARKYFLVILVLVYIDSCHYKISYKSVTEAFNRYLVRNFVHYLSCNIIDYYILKIFETQNAFFLSLYDLVALKFSILPSYLFIFVFL
jgi:hypothetical protein